MPGAGISWSSPSRKAGFMPPCGLTAGQKLMNLLVSRTLAASFEANLDFNRLKVPFRAIATDIETGDAVVLDHGLLHDAIRASTAIPLVFQPVEIDGRLLVDGGLVNNLPVEVVRGMGVDVVIAVDSSAKLEKKERLVSLVEIMSQSISLQMRKESERQAGLADLVITPDTSEYSFTDFPSMRGIIQKGEEAARAALPRIRELMKPKAGPGDPGAVSHHQPDHRRQRRGSGGHDPVGHDPGACSAGSQRLRHRDSAGRRLPPGPLFRRGALP